MLTSFANIFDLFDLLFIELLDDVCYVTFCQINKTSKAIISFLLKILYFPKTA